MSSIEIEIKKLVDKFSKDIEYYKNGSLYNEHNCRVEFIDPFLKILGWDISNEQGKSPQFREVITENYLADTGRPDYSMTLNGIIKFHTEAKKPSVNIELDKSPALQTRMYGWSSNLRISILTNFEYLIIYDTTVPPKEGDKVDVACIRKYHYLEYVEKIDEIFKLISRESVYTGGFDSYLDNSSIAVFEKGLQLPVDEYFLNTINDWRIKLGNYLYSHENYSIDIINDCIQEFINQIIFIRICEDRKLPLYHKLKEAINDENNVIKELDKIFREADKKYNSGLFSGEYIIFDLNNEIIKEIIEVLYYPQSPYKFELIKPNILGEIYELFLAEHLVIEDNKVVLESKDMNLHRDIVTTPLEIVKYMVERTCGEACIDKSPIQVLEMRFSDIACGSGIYLIETYEWLIRYCTNWYINNDRSYLIEDINGEFKLKFEYKKEILEKCIYGIDIDIHAVEVAKFNLILKLLEGETEPMLTGFDKILPDLNKNVIHGNALVDFDNINYNKLTDLEKEEIVPFSWDKINGGNLFDVIIGNPPYVTTEDIKNLINKKEIKVYKDKYSTSKGQYDKYFIFVERALQKIKPEGYLSYIIPNKFTKIKSGEAIRELLSKNKYVKEYIDFGSEQIFKKSKKTVYSSILLLQKKYQETFKYIEVDNMPKWFSNTIEKEIVISTDILGSLPWALVTDSDDMKLINQMYRNSVPLSEEACIFNGIQTSAERPPIYWFSEKEIIEETDKLFKIKKFNEEFLIEKSILKRYFKPVLKSEKNLGSYDVYSTDKHIIFPYNSDGVLYDIDIMKSEYPNTLNYLEFNYDELKPKQIDSSGRRDVPLAKKDTWYQYGRDQALTAFNNRKKLIVGVLSKKAMYLYDDKDLVIASGGTAGYCAISKKIDSKYELEYIQAYLSHPYTEKLLSIIGSDFEGGYYSRGTNILEKIPFKVLDFDNQNHIYLYNDIVSKTKKIHEINKKLSENKISKNKKAVLIDEKNYLINSIEEAITQIYNI